MKQIDTPIKSTVSKKRDKSKSSRVIHSSHYEERKIWGDSLLLLVGIISSTSFFMSSLIWEQKSMNFPKILRPQKY